MPTQDDDLEEEGLPQLYDPPPGQDIETDQTAPVVPRDRPMGVNQWGTTQAEERTDEPLYRRVRREEPPLGGGGGVGGNPPPPPVGPDSHLDELRGAAGEGGPRPRGGSPGPPPPGGGR